MISNLRIAVVVPAYNEARLVGRTVTAMPAFVDRIVVVDDGSTDSTLHAVSSIDDRRIVVVSHDENRGVGAAIRTGYSLAFGDGADVVAVMAADGQMDARDLERVIEPIVSGEADYVKGNRLSHPDAFRCMPRARYIGNHALSLLTSAVLGVRIVDSQCGFTAVSRRVAPNVSNLAFWCGYGYPNDVLGVLQLAGARIAEVVVRPIYGDETSGVRLYHALFVIPYVLLRVWLRKMRSLAQSRAPKAYESLGADHAMPLFGTSPRAVQGALSDPNSTNV